MKVRRSVVPCRRSVDRRQPPRWTGRPCIASGTSLPASPAESLEPVMVPAHAGNRRYALPLARRKRPRSRRLPWSQPRTWRGKDRCRAKLRSESALDANGSVRRNLCRPTTIAVRPQPQRGPGCGANGNVVEAGLPWRGVGRRTNGQLADRLRCRWRRLAFDADVRECR